MGKIVFAVSLVSALLMSNAFAGEKAPVASDAPAVDAATYKPKTKHDNTPWRFNMEQGGKQMSADEFDAWMKSKGVHVAKGPASAAPGAAAPASDAAATEVAAAADVQTAK